MKNFVKQLVIITLAVLIGFLFVSCSEPEPELPVITISQQPFERSVFAGDIFSLVVNAQVTQGATLSYQWYSNTTNSNVGGTVISGATNRHYINYTTLAAGTYYYFCEVNATGGAASVRTNVVAVNVAVPIITINTQPIAMTNLNFGEINESLTIEVSVLDGTEVSYQWYSNTVGYHGGSIIADATDESFSIPTTLAAGTYYYYCEVSTVEGVAFSIRSNVAIVNVLAPVITINTQPTPITNLIVENISGSLSVGASVTGGAELSYQWYYSEFYTWNAVIITGATNASYAIPTTLTAGTYFYYCEVSATNGAISVYSETAIVNVSVPVITINTQPTTTIVYVENISGSLSVGASVTDGVELSYQWYSNTTNSNTDGSIINGETNSSFIIPTTLTPGTYFYYCEVSATNGAKSVYSETAIVNVSVPVITINTQPTTTIVYVENISGSLSVGASVTGGAELSYQWYSNTTNSNTDGSIINGETSSSFIIPTTLTPGTYFYYCEVSATNGAISVRTKAAMVGVIVISSNGIEMVYVPAGSFELGRELNTSNDWIWSRLEDVTPVSTVNISGFHMSRYLVTQELYQAVMGTNPSYFHGGSGREPASGEVQERRPVEQVSWYDAIVFCNRLSIDEGLTPAYSISGSTNPADWGDVPYLYDNTWPIVGDNALWDTVQIVSGSTGYRLPTEAQWEYAAKGGNGSPGSFTFSGSDDPDAVAWSWENSGNRTHEVGKKAFNGLGIYDMSGNVSEWCWDRWGSYTSTTKTDPTGAVSGDDRVARGGSLDHSAAGTGSVVRNGILPFGKGYVLGFRLARP